MPAPRILLYSHDTYGLGHLRRSLAIAASIASHIPRSRQLLVTGSTVAGAFGLPPRLDMIKLPALSKRSSGEYMPRALPLSIDGTIDWRADMILQSVRHFQPDLLLVDKAPLGVCAELLPALEYLHNRKPDTRIVLGMRDIEDAPELTRREWDANGIYTALESYYDAILLYGQRSVFDPVEKYGLPGNIRDKIVECGFLRKPGAGLSARLVRRQLRLGDRPFVLVTAGGGGDGFPMIDLFLRMMEKGLGPDLNPMVVTGPLMPQDLRKGLAARARELSLNLIDFTPDLTSYMAAAELVISMAGYNTVCEILSGQKRAILIPRTQVRQEQRIRAAQLERLGLARMREIQDLTPASLGEDIRRILEQPRPHVALNMDGLGRATKEIARQLRAPGETRSPVLVEQTFKEQPARSRSENA